MRPKLAAIAAQQGGVVSRRQAVESGYSLAEIRGLSRKGGAWVVVRRGAYVTRELWDAMGEVYGGQLGLTDRGVHLTLRTSHMVSHDSAARAWGLGTLNAPKDLVHVTREGHGNARTRHGVKHHRTRLGLLNTIKIDGMRLTSLSRTAVDIAREHGFIHGLAALDGAMRAGVSRELLRAEFNNMWCWPGSCDIRDAIELADPGADNPGETLLRLMCLEAGVEPESMTTQFPVLLPNGRIAWIDIGLRRHLLELDGRKKYLSSEFGGVAKKAVEDVLWDERTRQNAICSQGFGMSRVTFEELTTRQKRARTWERVVREKAVTVRRFGTELTPAMKQFAESMEGERQKRIIRPLVPQGIVAPGV